MSWVSDRNCKGQQGRKRPETDQQLPAIVSTHFLPATSLEGLAVMMMAKNIIVGHGVWSLACLNVA